MNITHEYQILGDRIYLEPLLEILEKAGAEDRVCIEWAAPEITNTRVRITTPLDRVTLPVEQAPDFLRACLCEMGFYSALDSLDILSMVETEKEVALKWPQKCNHV